jgi:PKD repeat protein
VTNVFAAPVAAFTASPTNGAAPLLVNFTDASTGTVTNHSWSFGDGNTSAAASPSHSYSTAGVYSVTLTVLGPGGSGATNRVNLITVTNAVNTPPTVSIARPANGMLYPPAVTNQTITIVAHATANDGGTISKIEFFADGTKLGETTNNPGTNFLVHPTLGAHIISARASDSLGITNISAGVTVTVGAKNSPLGDWEVTISGADKGAQFLTFEDDFTANGFGIRLKTPALEDVTGTWTFTNKPKGQVTGPFLGQSDGTTNWTGVFKGPSNNSKTLSGSVPTTQFGTFHWRGVPPNTIPVLTGTWTGTVAIVRTTPVDVSYILSPNASDSGVFDIAASTDTNTVVGELLVTSRNKVYAFVTFNTKEVHLSGTFSTPRATATLTLRGTDSSADRVTIKIVK